MPLCDGHKIRFDEVFLRYIHSPANRWGCGVGTPYGTSLWQLADGLEQNVNNNQLNTRNKKKRYDYKISLGLPGQLECYEIMPLLNESWSKSFGNISSNITTIADRGWDSLNRVLLDHPEILQTVTHLDIGEEGGKVYGDIEAVSTQSAGHTRNSPTPQATANSHMIVPSIPVPADAPPTTLPPPMIK